jgi:hypothetical protein
MVEWAKCTQSVFYRKVKCFHFTQTIGKNLETLKNSDYKEKTYELGVEDR